MSDSDVDDFEPEPERSLVFRIFRAILLVFCVPFGFLMGIMTIKYVFFQTHAIVASIFLFLCVLSWFIAKKVY